MTPFEEAMAAPRIEVIDAAIEFLQGVRPGGVAYSCTALHRAAIRAHHGTLGPSEAHQVALRYVKQYQQSCLTAGPGPRLRAIRRFRQLCLDAAK